MKSKMTKKRIFQISFGSFSDFVVKKKIVGWDGGKGGKKKGRLFVERGGKRVWKVSSKWQVLFFFSFFVCFLWFIDTENRGRGKKKEREERSQREDRGGFKLLDRFEKERGKRGEREGKERAQK